MDTLTWAELLQILANKTLLVQEPDKQKAKEYYHRVKSMWLAIVTST